MSSSFLVAESTLSERLCCTWGHRTVQKPWKKVMGKIVSHTLRAKQVSAIDYLICFVKKFATFFICTPVSLCTLKMNTEKCFCKQLSSPCGKWFHLSFFFVRIRSARCEIIMLLAPDLPDKFKLGAPLRILIECHFVQLLKYYPSFEFVIIARDRSNFWIKSHLFTAVSPKC